MRGSTIIPSACGPRCGIRCGSRSELTGGHWVGAWSPGPGCVPIVVLSAESGMFNDIIFVRGLEIVQVCVPTTDEVNRRCNTSVFTESSSDCGQSDF